MKHHHRFGENRAYTLFFFNPVLLVLILLAAALFSGVPLKPPTVSKITPPVSSSPPMPKVRPAPTLATTGTPIPSPTGPTLTPAPTTSFPFSPTVTTTPTPEVKGEQTQEALVTQVIDGDTIEIEGGLKVRYIGIDTPETVHPHKPVQCFGEEASNQNKELVGGKRVRLEKDISETDKYGRLLRYVWVGNLLVNDYLVRQGYAQSSTYPPDVRYQDRFLQAQREARENRRGLWGKCGYFGAPFTEPTPKLTATPTPNPGPKVAYDCSGNVHNCSDFRYQEEAQNLFDYCGGVSNDTHKLDGDRKTSAGDYGTVS